MKSRDPYAATDKLEDSLLQVIVTRLEARGKHSLLGRAAPDVFTSLCLVLGVSAMPNRR